MIISAKTVRSKYGEFQVDVPQDRQSSFEPQVLPKRQKDISSIDDKIIALYAKGMTTRQISEMIEDIYSFEVSEGMVSDITDKLLPRIEEWQNRPLSPVYPIVFIDAVHFSVRDDGVMSTRFLPMENWNERATRKKCVLLVSVSRLLSITSMSSYPLDTVSIQSRASLFVNGQTPS